MNKILTLIFIMVNLLFIYQSASALTITSPKENEIVYAGSQMTVIAKPDAGEEWISVSLGIDPMTYNPFTKEYKITVLVPKDYSGYYDNLFVFAADRNNKSIQLRRTIFVKLPPNVTLQGIVAGNNSGGKSVLPLGSKAVDIENYETEQLSVHGQYSDDVTREITSSASGTTYTSSNEKVVTVSSEGKVTAHEIGEANITVRNGKYNETIKVKVKQFK
jgi:hypothetical protein